MLLNNSLVLVAMINRGDYLKAEHFWAKIFPVIFTFFFFPHYPVLILCDYETSIKYRLTEERMAAYLSFPFPITGSGTPGHH